MKLKQSMSVLVCDDAAGDVNDLTCILAYSYGSAVKTTVFNQASDTLSYIRSGAEVDVCFLETVTPGMDGIKLANDLRSTGYEGGIVFLTRSRSFAPDSYEVKAIDYLMKPIMPEKIRSALHKAQAKMQEVRI